MRVLMTKEEKKARAEKARAERQALEERFPGFWDHVEHRGGNVYICIEAGDRKTLEVHFSDLQESDLSNGYFWFALTVEKTADLISALSTRYNAAIEDLNKQAKESEERIRQAEGTKIETGGGSHAQS